MDEQLEHLFKIAFEKTEDYKFYRDNGMSDTQIFSKKRGKYECYTVKQTYIVWCEAMEIVKKLKDSLQAIQKQY